MTSSMAFFREAAANTVTGPPGGGASDARASSRAAPDVASAARRERSARRDNGRMGVMRRLRQCRYAVADHKALCDLGHRPIHGIRTMRPASALIAVVCGL